MAMWSGVAVQPVGAEAEHHLGAEAAHLQHQPLHHLVGRGANEGPRVLVGSPARHSRVPVAPNVVAGQTQGPHRAGKLDAANPAEGFTGSRSLLPYLALLAEGRGDEPDVDAPLGVGGQDSSHGKGFVVGMGETGKQTVFKHNESVRSGVLHSQTPFTAEGTVNMELISRCLIRP